MARASRRARSRSASSWDKIDGQATEDTIANRDVHEDQQLGRAKKIRLQSKTPGRVAAGVVALATAVLVWVLYSVVASLVSFGVAQLSDTNSHGNASESYFSTQTISGPHGKPTTCYHALNERGVALHAGQCYSSAKAVPVPTWWTASHSKNNVHSDSAANSGVSISQELGAFSLLKAFATLVGAAGLGLAVLVWFGRRVGRTNATVDHSDINDHRDDQRLATVEEVQRKYDIFPDLGAHSSVQVSSMLSHSMLSKKGLGNVQMTQRADEDVVDDDANVLYYRGEELVDDDGEVTTYSAPIIDESFGDALFDASELPKDKNLRIRYDASQISYNPGGKDRDKLNYQTVADLVKGDWTIPGYETQRPAGFYVTDSSPTNTMVLAMTRAGKGQTYIEPILDMWSRERKPSNMLLNDPKGELLRMNYVSLVKRGFQPVQFNLINRIKTDVYNPVGLAAEAARESDGTKCAQYVENLGDVFFPVDGAEDPMWPTAANNAFKRMVYGLIDFYLEEERELREVAEATGMAAGTLDQKLDVMWGKVSLYNAYQMFVQLSSKKMKNPKSEFDAKKKAGEFADVDVIELEEMEAKAIRDSAIWNDKPDLDMLTLYFNATQALPKNMMRTMVADAHNTLVTMADAEKMLASVYGITTTAMNFFVDPTIATLTSGTPSQNIDLGGMSFPRRLGVRFAQAFVARNHLKGLTARWSAYGDAMFTADLGPEFEHTDLVTPEGWARYFFEGKFPDEQAWVKLELINSQTKMLVRTFYFHFRKNHKLSMNGRHFVIEPVTGSKIIQNGVLQEVRPVYSDDDHDGAGEIVAFEPGQTQYPRTRLDLSSDVADTRETQARAIIQTMVRYSESPKAVFLITPPHLSKYAKLILVLLKQMVDVSFEQSYMTKANQKPLYRTRYLLDELGNLESEGHGIADFQRMLSIGLGQEQQFTLILQTLQQLLDVYGDSVDKIVQGNVGNIIFLKSTDDTMLETMEKLSGNRHVTRAASKQITENKDKIGTNKLEGTISRTYQTEKEPVISYNNMAFLPPRNSIVFRAGDAPIWNRNSTILPMSYKLQSNKMVHPGHEDYTLQTIPTQSTAGDFDVRANQPDFFKMLDKRMKQAVEAPQAAQIYQSAYGLNDTDIARKDPDVYADEVMEIVASQMAGGRVGDEAQVIDLDDDYQMQMIDDAAVVDNVIAQTAIHEAETLAGERGQLMYAESTVSKDMLVTPTGAARVKTLDAQLAEAFVSSALEMERDTDHFSIGGNGELRSADGSEVYITPVHSSKFAAAVAGLNASASSPTSSTFAEDDIDVNDLNAMSTWQVHAGFYHYLASLPSWEVLADGAFDRAMAVEMRS